MHPLPFLRKSIRKLLGDSITLIDTSDAVVRQLRRKLESLCEVPHHQEHGSILFVSSKDGLALLKMSQELMQSDLSMHHVDWQLEHAFK